MMTLIAAAALAAAAQGSAAPAANDYANEANWLCRPGRADACRTDQSATVIEANGNTRVKRWSAASNAPVDCFYVYPTVSFDRTANSDMTAGREEAAVVNQQLNRFASQCRIFAPLYRQVTITALRAGAAGQPMPGVDRELAYRDVRDAWQQYMRTDNKGRGVVLLGHSQGSGVLKRLIAEEIDGKPVQQQLVGAYLAGTNVMVPAGQVTGGDFKSVPLCTSAGQTGCVASWVTFRNDVPPPASSRFGRTTTAGMKVACVNPAGFGTAEVPLDAYMNAGATSLSEQAPVTWARGKKVSTPFAQVPGLLTGACVDRDNAQYLAVTVHGDPADPRTDTIAGDVVQGGKVQADWGLHLVDVNVVMGNMVDNVARQASAYASANR